MKYSYDFVKNFIEKESDFGCKLITTKEEYRNAQQKLSIKCKCGIPFSTTFSKFMLYDGKHSKRQCNKCGLESRRTSRIKSYKEIKQYIEKESGCNLLTTKEEYEHELLDNKKSPSTIKLKLLCKECNTNTFDITIRRFNERRKCWCHDCSMKHRSETYEKVKYFVEVESNSRCKLLSSSYNDDCLEPLQFKCWCGTKFETSYASFKNGNKCNCGQHNISNGEKIIEEFFKSNNINYKPQYTFRDCRDEKVLPFDFAVMDDGENIKCLIEYNGKQHYEPCGFGEKDESKIIKKFNEQLKHDKIKEDYCKSNDIKLMIIPYWEYDNLENILFKELT